MKNWKTHAAVAAVLLAAVCILGVLFAEPVWAQVRATLVRDIDNPALAPFRARVDYASTFANAQQLVTTVPAGKRLVIEHISFFSSGPTGDQLVFLALRTGQFGPLRFIAKIDPPHASVHPSYTIQDGGGPVKLYFEAGEEVWISYSHNTSGARDLDMSLTGHWVTP